MDKEYRANQRKQKKTFKKFRKYIGRIFLWAGIGIASAAFFPGAAVMGALKGVLGDLLATSVAFFGQWGIASVGFIGAMVNAIKARHAAKTIDDSQEEEENIVDCIVRDKEQAEIKLNNLERVKVKENEQEKELDLKLVKDNSSITNNKDDTNQYTQPQLTVLPGGNEYSDQYAKPELTVLPGGAQDVQVDIKRTGIRKRKTKSISDDKAA